MLATAGHITDALSGGAVRNYIVARLLAIIPTTMVLILFVVVLIRLLPGDAIDVLLEEQVRLDDVSRGELEARLGLDKSLPEEFVRYTLGTLRGDLGNSIFTEEPVTGLIRQRIGVTLTMGVMALVIGATTGVVIGIISAVRRNSLLDYVLRSVSIAGLSIPNFAIATAVIVFPTIWWKWSPPVIYTPPGDGIWPYTAQFFTPAIILGLSLSASLMRLTRTMMLEVLRQDYITTARSKGLHEGKVVLRHALRNALIPVVSLLGIQVAFLLSGTVILESIFSLPGLGRTLIGSLSARDYPVVQGLTVVSGLLVIMVNLMVDFSYGVLDPRTRTE